MTQILFRRCDGEEAGAPVVLPKGRRRLSAIVKKHADRSRPHIVMISKRGQPITGDGQAVRQRATWSKTMLGPRDTVVVVYLPRGGAMGGGGGGGGQNKGLAIGLVVAAIALAAVGQFWGIAALGGVLNASAATAGTIWSAATAAQPAGPCLLIPKGNSTMTSVIAFAREESATIYTDGRSYSRDGDIIGQTNKVDILAHLPAVIACRGQTLIRNAISYQAAEAFKTFDELLLGIVDLLRQVRTALGVPDDVAVQELTVAGWSSARDAAEVWTVSDADRPDLPAFELREVAAVVSPLDASLMAAIDEAGLDLAGGAPDELGPVIMRLQRDRAWIVPHNGRSVRSVGDHCQETVVQRDNISTRIVERWAA